jgi:hypothetical protein
MANMFAKVFSQIFDSTIAEDYKVRHVFMDLLVMSDSDGVVDKTPEAISRIANVPLDQVKAGLFALAQPDLKSRTKEHDGCRIQLIDENRDWGWRIVNFQKYREIRDEEARRIANRSYKRDQRRRSKESAASPDSQQGQPKSAHTEVEVEAEAERSRATTLASQVVEIYQLYPKKVGKREAFKAITAAIGRVERGEYKGGKLTETQAVAGIKNRTIMFAQSAAGRRGKMTPHPATWFNRSSYLDDPKEWSCDDEGPSKTQARVSHNREAILAGLGFSPQPGPSEPDLQDGDDVGGNSTLEGNFEGSAAKLGK